MSIPFDRGQTEPLAALVAVSMLAIGISVFAGYYTDTLPGTSDRNVAEPTTEQVWDELERNGIYHKDEKDLSEIVADPTDPDETEILPAGWYVYVNVTYPEDDAEVVRHQSVAYGPTGEPAPDVADHLEANGAPENAQYRSRPIPLKWSEGDVRVGKLNVHVWQN